MRMMFGLTENRGNGAFLGVFQNQHVYGQYKGPPVHYIKMVYFNISTTVSTTQAGYFISDPSKEESYKYLQNFPSPQN